MSKNFQDLTIKDAFMFAAVMSDEKQCQRFLELVLETKILAVSVIAEKSLEYRPDYHGVRLDVLAEEAGQRRRFNVEMQVKRKPDLPWRSRYYHSQLEWMFWRYCSEVAANTCCLRRKNMIQG